MSRGCDFDLAIVGAGFGGSLLAMVARRIGLRVALLERGRHPRFAIGESTSPLMNLLIEELARRYDLPRLLPLTSFGPWQRTYPEVTCGLKRGFTYYHHSAGRSFANHPDRRDQLMVAASPADEVADTHWLRADVDWFLLREALALGVEYADEARLTGLERRAGGWQIEGERAGRPMRVSARLVVDATGPRGFFSRALGIGERGFDSGSGTQALYSHFTGVRRCDEMPEYARPAGETPPYPADDAALHHVFDGGWMWALRFGNGVTSAGVALTDSLADAVGLCEGEAGWRRLQARFPTIAAQFEGAEAVRPFTYAPRLAYRAEAAVGEGWALLPSAAAFVDPLFSTGMPLTLLGIERLGRMLERGAAGGEALAEYGRRALAEADGVARYGAACYAGFGRFPLFVAHSMFYFAAASYSEMARRLERPELVTSYLALDRAPFRAAMERCGDLLAALDVDADEFAARVANSIAPLNVAGLADPAKGGWYPVDLEDVVRGAAKLGHTPEAMRAILATAPWAQVTAPV